MKTKKCLAAIAIAALLMGHAASASAATCPNGRSSTGALWLSVLHPGLGEYHLNGYGSWSQNMPQRKFWMGWIPFFGFPYLTIVSAVDAANCRTDDNLNVGP